VLLILRLGAASSRCSLPSHPCIEERCSPVGDQRAVARSCLARRSRSALGEVRSCSARRGSAFGFCRWDRSYWLWSVLHLDVMAHLCSNGHLPRNDSVAASGPPGKTSSGTPVVHWQAHLSVPSLKGRGVRSGESPSPNGAEPKISRPNRKRRVDDLGTYSAFSPTIKPASAPSSTR